MLLRLTIPQKLAIPETLFNEWCWQCLFKNAPNTESSNHDDLLWRLIIDGSLDTNNAVHTDCVNYSYVYISVIRPLSFVTTAVSSKGAS